MVAMKSIANHQLYSSIINYNEIVLQCGLDNLLENKDFLKKYLFSSFHIDYCILFGQPFLNVDWLKHEHEITWKCNSSTKN